MPKKITKRAKVVLILQTADSPLSISDIKDRYYKKYNKPIGRKTITAAIFDSLFVNDNIKEAEQRRHNKKIPVKVYSIINS